MAFDAQKQIRENTIELQDFLKDLRQWEHRVKEKDKKLKSQSEHEEVEKIPPIRGHGERLSSVGKHKVLITQHSKGEMPTTLKDQPPELREKIKPEVIPTTAAGHTYDYYHDKWGKFDMEAALREADGGDESSGQKITGKNAQGSPSVLVQTGGEGESASVMPYMQINQRSGNLGKLDNLPSASQSSETRLDANSEKELGNKHFKEKKFVQAIECYSRSIMLQQSAVAYANRAMAYIKIRRFEEAERDCTEAIALDDRYVKAYSRRGTARKELRKFLAAVEDAEFALRLEPDNKELKQQYLEAKSLCEKNSSVKVPERKVSLPIEEIQTHASKLDNKGENNLKSLHSGEKLISSSGDGPRVDGLQKPKAKPEVPNEQSADKALVSLQAVAAQTAAAHAAGVVTAAPKTFYEFESMWKSFSGNPGSRAELIKAIHPPYLPSLFKDNLSSKLLSEMIHTLEWVFQDNASLAVAILENLTKVRRFNMMVMCFTSKEKTELRELWERVFIEGEKAGAKSNILSDLRVKYQL